MLHPIRSAGFILCAALALPCSFGQSGEPAIASAEHQVGGVTVDLLQVKRETPTVVTVRWRYTNTTDQPKQLTKQRTGSIDAYRLALNSYLLDETKRIKYPLSRDTDNEPVASRNGETNKYIFIGPKATINVWAKYIVPDTTSRVGVVIEGVSPFSGIEITH